MWEELLGKSPPRVPHRSRQQKHKPPGNTRAGFNPVHAARGWDWPCKDLPLRLPLPAQGTLLSPLPTGASSQRYRQHQLRPLVKNSERLHGKSRRGVEEALAITLRDQRLENEQGSFSSCKTTTGPCSSPGGAEAVQTDSPAKALSQISYAVLEERGEISENLH